MSKIDTVCDYEMIKEFMTCDPELCGRISDDYTNIKNWTPESYIWFGFFDGTKCKALLQVSPETATVLNIHINIPQEHRGADSYKMGNSLLSHLEKVCNKKYIKINAKIPIIYKDVLKYSIKNGFEIEGLDRQSYVKNGNVYDRHIVGKIIER